MVTFTGSTATGRRIMASAAPTVKRVQLELGGKSAQVVLDDVSEDYARSIGFGAVLAHCGQGCVIQTRLLLPEHLLDAYKEGVAAAAPDDQDRRPARPGDGARPTDPRAAACAGRGLRAVRASSRAPSCSPAGSVPTASRRGSSTSPPCSSARTTCASRRRRSSARCSPSSRTRGTTTTRSGSPTTRSTASAAVSSPTAPHARSTSPARSAPGA